MNTDMMLTYLNYTYFDEDYRDQGLSPLDLIRKFSELEGIQYVQLLFVEMAEMLAVDLDEEGARQLWMDQAGSRYDPTDDGVGYLEWLRTVLLTVGSVLRRRWLTPRKSLHPHLSIAETAGVVDQTQCVNR